MSVKSDVRAQLIGALAKAKFPIETPQALLAAMPNGADTVCQSGSVRVTAGEAGQVLKASDFPFRSKEQVADTIVNRAGLPD